MSEYENDATINLQVRVITALVFVPAVDVPAVFVELRVYVNARLDEIMDYVEDNYVGRRSRNGRKRPRFVVDWWNVYDRTLNGDPRTNDHAEAGDRK